MLDREQIEFLQFLFPRRHPDGVITPPEAAGFHHQNQKMQKFADFLIEAGLIERRGVDTCGIAWFWPLCFNEVYEAVTRIKQ